jgi:hypothetical protein
VTKTFQHFMQPWSFKGKLVQTLSFTKSWSTWDWGRATARQGLTPEALGAMFYVTMELCIGLRYRCGGLSRIVYHMGRDYAQNLYNWDGHLCSAMDDRLQRIGNG